MIEIYNNLYIGEDIDCEACTSDSGFSIVHACQSCHQRLVKIKGPLPYIYEDGSHLYLNLVDSPFELPADLTNPMFKNAINFIYRELQNKKVLVHCNFGYSRSPSIGMIYLAATGTIPNNDFDVTVNEFVKLYPKYGPGTGITLYLLRNWDFLTKELI